MKKIISFKEHISNTSQDDEVEDMLYNILLGICDPNIEGHEPKLLDNYEGKMFVYDLVTDEIDNDDLISTKLRLKDHGFIIKSIESGTSSKNYYCLILNNLFLMSILNWGVITWDNLKWKQWHMAEYEEVYATKHVTIKSEGEFISIINGKKHQNSDNEIEIYNSISDDEYRFSNICSAESFLIESQIKYFIK
jgi:hypothetical protein